MLETKIRKKILVEHILRALRIDNMLGRSSHLEQDERTDFRVLHENSGAYQWVTHEKAMLNPEYVKAEATMNSQRSRALV